VRQLNQDMRGFVAAVGNVFDNRFAGIELFVGAFRRGGARFLK